VVLVATIARLIFAPPDYSDYLMHQHPFDESLRFSPVDDDTVTGQPPLAYWNMVGPFGGMTAAILLAAVLRHPEQIGEPVALTVNYCGPLKDRPYTMRTRLIRSNKSTQHWHVELSQSDPEAGDRDDICVSQATVVMGIRRDSWSRQAMQPPKARPASECQPRPGRKDIVWFDRFDMRYVHNPMTDASADAAALTWVADNPPRKLDYLSLTNRCDALFPAIFAHRQKIDPIATVSLNIYFHTSKAELAEIGNAHTLGVSRTNVHHEGFADSEAWVWSDDRLIATTQQLMWYRTD